MTFNSNQSILLYDGQCNFCVKVMNVLAFLGRFNIRKKTKYLRLISYQGNKRIFQKYALSYREVASQIHLITPEGVYRGKWAIIKLGEYFPIIKPFTLIFITPWGNKIYQYISRYRYLIFGCHEECSSSTSTNRS